MSEKTLTQKEHLLKLFRDNHRVMTLGEILRSPVGYEWRARATELRRQGYKIELIERHPEAPSANIYQLSEPIEIKLESDGQACFA